MSLIQLAGCSRANSPPCVIDIARVSDREYRLLVGRHQWRHQPAIFLLLQVGNTVAVLSASWRGRAQYRKLGELRRVERPDVRSERSVETGAGTGKVR